MIGDMDLARDLPCRCVYNPISTDLWWLGAQDDIDRERVREDGGSVDRVCGPNNRVARRVLYNFVHVAYIYQYQTSEVEK